MKRDSPSIMMRRTACLLLALALTTLLTLTPIAYAQQLEIKLVSLTSPVSPSEKATITIQTAPNASCLIKVFYRSGLSRARGLDPKTTDSKGLASWTWLVGSRTTPGTWPITVTCSTSGREGKLQTSFIVR